MPKKFHRKKGNLCSIIKNIMDKPSSTDYICPMPDRWNEVYNSLTKVWEREGQGPHDKPPIPLILAAWHEATGLMKAIRWQETIEWAERHSCSHLIPKLKEEEKFKG